MKTGAFVNASIARMEGERPYGQLEGGAVVIEEGLISWVGPASEIPKQYQKLESYDLDGRLVTPAFIDCHTHIIHAGDRAREFEMRLNGASYEQIARAGGGIVSTVSATRSAGEEDLLASALPRIDALLSEGVSLIEVKSGYGLDRETELRMLRAARAIETRRPVRIKTTFLGAHAVPAEYQDRADAYIDEVCLPALETAHAEGLVDAVDGFCERIGFTTDQIMRVFDRAKALGLPVKLHAEQLSNSGGTELATQYGALSADHLEYAGENDVCRMAKAGTAAVLLPGAFYTLRESKLPPISAFRKYGVPVALATDCNPGSSPLTSLLLTMNLACTLFTMTPEEALAGVTCHAARALGVADTGVIKAGLRADLAIWDVAHPAELAYRAGFNPLHKRIFGELICPLH